MARKTKAGKLPPLSAGEMEILEMLWREGAVTLVVRPADDAEAFYDAVLARVRALPGIDAAGLITTLPFGPGATTSQNGNGDTWIPASIRPSCMPSRREATAAIMECEW